MIELVDEKDIKNVTIDNKGRLHKVPRDRKCCYPGCKHPYETHIDPKTGHAAWYKVKTIVNGKNVWDGKSWYCNEHEHKMRKQIRKDILDPISNKSKGDRIERAFERIEYRNCNRENDDYNFPYDIYDPIKKLKIQVRSTEIKLWKKKWTKEDGTEGLKIYSGWFIGLSEQRDYDTLFAVCTTKDYLDIESIYIIPQDKLPTSLGFYIYKENIESHLPIKSQFSDYKDEELLEKVRESYRQILIEDGIIKS